MKTITVAFCLFLFGLQHTSAQQEQSCALANTGQRGAIRDAGFHCPEKDGFYPDPKECAGFYRCVNGEQFKFCCQGGSVWDDSIKACNYPYNVPGCEAEKSMDS